MRNGIFRPLRRLTGVFLLTGVALFDGVRKAKLEPEGVGPVIGVELFIGVFFPGVAKGLRKLDFVFCEKEKQYFYSILLWKEKHNFGILIKMLSEIETKRIFFVFLKKLKSTIKNVKS